MARGFRNRFRNRDKPGDLADGTARMPDGDAQGAEADEAANAATAGGAVDSAGMADSAQAGGLAAGSAQAAADASDREAQSGPGHEADPNRVTAIVDDSEGEWLAYELHEWALESRLMLSQLLVADELVHSWQGTTLLAHHSTEEQVDRLIEEVQVAEKLELDAGQPQMAFEMQGWSGEMQAELTERLGAQSIPHEFDSDGDLACHEADEARIEAIIDELLAEAADEGLEELEGLEANDLLSALFESTDRLRRDVRDSAGVLGAVQHGRRLSVTATPFGFSAANWAQLRSAAGELADLLESDESSELEVGELATRLRDALLPVI